MIKFILLVISFFVFIVLLFGTSVFGLLFSAFRGGKRNQNAKKANSRQDQSRTSQTKPPQKIITPDEGEYIDFEEIKD